MYFSACHEWGFLVQQRRNEFRFDKTFYYSCSQRDSRVLKPGVSQVMKNEQLIIDSSRYCMSGM
jgi:hypothetical protein